MHPNESARTGCFHTYLALDRLRSPAAGFEDRRLSLQRGNAIESHFEIFESLLVTLGSLDIKDSNEHLDVFCFKLGEHTFSVLGLRKPLSINSFLAPFLVPVVFLLVEGFLSRHLDVV